jgi:ABC-type molybdate transport system ATPase subunit
MKSGKTARPPSPTAELRVTINRPDDAIIAVMGMTGVGKSSFVSFVHRREGTHWERH